MNAPDALRLDLDALRAIHERAVHPLACGDVFGDAALLERVPVASRLRERVLAIGFRIADADTAFDGLYRIAPLTLLPAILEERVLPAVATIRAVHRARSIAPVLRVSEASLPLLFGQSTLSHESAHAVAHIELGAMGLDAIMAALMGEAFANTAETLIALSATTRSTAVIVALNSFVTPLTLSGRGHRALDLAALRALVDADARAVSRALLGAFLAANLRPQAMAVPRALVERVLHLVAAGPSLQPDAAAAFFELAFNLSPQFRRDTSALHFELLGQSQEYAATLQIPLAEVFADGGWFGAASERLATCLCDDAGTPTSEAA